MMKLVRLLKKVEINWWNVTLLLCIFFFCLIAFYFGQSVPYSEQSSAYEGLRTTSGIIFAVMGAWIAIVHPGSLGGFFSAQKVASKQMLRLLSTMLISAFILAAVLLVGVTVPALKHIYLVGAYRSVLRGLSYSILCFLTMLQMWCLFLALLPNYIVKEKLKRAESEEELEHHLTGKK